MSRSNMPAAQMQQYDLQTSVPYSGGKQWHTNKMTWICISSLTGGARAVLRQSTRIGLEVGAGAQTGTCVLSRAS
eukprot:6208585-Pleurochrysis_carterae.AAC.5